MNQENQEKPLPDNTKKMGTIMMVLAWAVVLGLLVLFFTHTEENAYNPNRWVNGAQNATENSVVLERNRFNHYVVNGEINRQTVTFLLDTGATDVVIPEILANTLQLTQGRKQFAKTANGVIEVFDTSLNELTIGSITLYNVNASINPSMDGEQILLGMSALKNIEFTQRGNQLTLKQYR